jgi:hypothetical protein
VRDDEVADPDHNGLLVCGVSQRRVRGARRSASNEAAQVVRRLQRVDDALAAPVQQQR